MQMNNEACWFVYLLKCGDNSLYCGIAKNVADRLEQHRLGKGARYTRGRTPLKMIWQLQNPVEHGEALRMELAIKKMPRAKKLLLTKSCPYELIERYSSIEKV